MPTTTTLKDTTTTARAKAKDLRDSTREALESTFKDARDYSHRAQDMAKRAGNETVVFVRKHPINSALAAGIFGLFAGWLIGRRR